MSASTVIFHSDIGNYNDSMNRLEAIKYMLVYLETPECRAYMNEINRRKKIKKMTELFRNEIKLNDCSPPQEPLRIRIPYY